MEKKIQKLGQEIFLKLKKNIDQIMCSGMRPHTSSVAKHSDCQLALYFPVVRKDG
jgi:hypothetical protein